MDIVVLEVTKADNGYIITYHPDGRDNPSKTLVCKEYELYTIFSKIQEDIRRDLPLKTKGYEQYA